MNYFKNLDCVQVSHMDRFMQTETFNTNLINLCNS